MNLLYLSCHEVLEYDELRMFMEIPGLNVFSPGSYLEPMNGSSLRPGLNISYPQEWLDAWVKIKATAEHPDHKWHVTPAVTEHFDVIIVQHDWDMVFRNIDAFKGKTVIWRDIGQTAATDETWEERGELPWSESGHIKRAQDLGVKIVRYWDGYQSRSNYQGHDAIIPFAKYPSDFHEWNNTDPSVMTVMQRSVNRSQAVNYQLWLDSTKGMKRVLYGNGSEDAESYGGPLSYRSMIQKMSEHRLYWYGGTKPAPYTLSFMEAMFSGIPIVTVKEPGWEEWGVPQWLSQEQVAKTHSEVGVIMSDLLNSSDSHLCSISNQQISNAKQIWDVDAVSKQWELFLKEL